MHTTEFQYLKSNQNSHLFLAHYSPLDQSADKVGKHVVVLVPPFAEEMNRSKRMYVLCARLLANSGLDALCFDYSGTGDSSGKWGEFSYDNWVSDLQDVYHFSKSLASDVSFIALRFGALIVADAIAAKQLSVKKCLLWDPLESGDVLTRQLVRMKIAAAMTDNAKKITSQSVMQMMENDGYMESAGYHISQSMFRDINDKKLASMIPALCDNVNMHWMSSAKPSAKGNVWLANSFKQEALTSQQMSNLHMHALGDVKFWMQQEVTIAPRMLQHTQRVMTSE